MSRQILVRIGAIILILALLGDYQPVMSKPASQVSRVIPSAAQPATLPAEGYIQSLPILFLPGQPTLFGVEMQVISNKAGLGQMVQAGVYWMRFNSVWWPDVEPEKGQRNWQALAGVEQDLVNAVPTGGEVILIVRGTPAWAQKVEGSSCGPIKEEELQSFASFMYDLVKRYSSYPYYVKYWELLNEPDASINYSDEPYGCWGDSSDAYYGGGAYAEMLKAVYPQMKAANPNIQVLFGGLLLDCDPNNPPEDPPGSGQYKNCDSAKYLEGALINGGGDYFDILSFHAYDYYQGEWGLYSNQNWHSSWDTTGPSMAAKKDFIVSVLDQYGYADKPLMNTEVALLCYSDCNDAFEATKAYYLAEAFAMAKSLGLQANVWYDLHGSWRHTGLIDWNGTPKPAYYAFQAGRRLFGSAQYNRTFKELLGITGYEFLREDSRLWIVWSKDGNIRTLTLPGIPAAMWDTLGNKLTPSSQLILDINPIYIEWDY